MIFKDFMIPTNNLGNILGEICKIIWPIPEEIHYGNPKSEIAICTLSSIEVFNQIANSDLINRISLVGRLLSENKGIDAIIRYVNINKKIKKIIVCGEEVLGHKAGHSLFQLHQFGIDNCGKIINSTSPDPHLKVAKSQIDYFQNEICLINMINETNLAKIKKVVI